MDSAEFRMLSGLRVLLAASALLITWIDPSEPSHFVETTYTTLAAYVVYALALYAISAHDLRLPATLHHALPWIDVALYAVLIGLSGGSNSIYFILFIYPLLGAAFRSGYTAGITLTIVSVALFVILGLATARNNPDFNLGRFLLRSSSLPVLGFIIAYFGGYELRLRRRLALLRDLSTMSSPRTNASRAVARALQRLREFYDADACLMVLEPRHGRSWEIRRAGRNSREDDPGVESVPAAVAQTLLGFDEREVVFYRAGSRVWSERLTGSSDANRVREIAELLGVPTFISVPLRLGVRGVGRVFIGGDHPTFDADDCEFLLHALDQLMSAIDYIDLVDRMTSRSIDDERRRIALDIHDRVLQPYIGLQLATAALHRVATNQRSQQVPPAVTTAVEKLLQLTNEGIANLRQYTHALRADASQSGFAESMRRFAEVFQEATGIEILFRGDDAIHMEDRFAAELFSMATEAASNVRRHTASRRVNITVTVHDERLILRVENEVEAGIAIQPFIPRSICERAAALLGSVAVETGERTTVVLVQLPYSAAAPSERPPLASHAGKFGSI